MYKYINPRFYIQRFPKLWEFAKFAMVGLLNTAIDFCIFYVLINYTYLNHENGIVYLALAHIISFCVAVINSYILNKYWTFKSDDKDVTVQFSKFMGVSIVGLILSTAILTLLVTYADFNELVAKVAAIIIVLFWNYFANKFWTFKKK